MRESVALTTPWFDLLARSEDSSPEPFYCLRMPDYVAVVPVTERGTVLLVRQFRSAVQKRTLELPAGHVDSGESPEQAAIRELEEETGYQTQRIELIGVLNPDTGRLSNRMWCYFAEVSRASAGKPPEAGIEIVETAPEELLEMLRLVQFDHALHVAALLLCGFQGRLPFLSLKGLAL
jgi:ADP-ribose pyrophosphatase